MDWRSETEGWERREAAVRRVLSAIHVRLARGGHPGEAASAAAAAMDLAESDLDGGEYRSALALSRDAHAWLGSTADDAAIARCRLLEGRAQLHLGALDEARTALSDAADAAGPFTDVSLAARSELASLLLQSAEWVAAREQLERVVADATRTLGAEHDTTLDARATLAESVGMAGDLAAMKRQLEDLLQDRERAFGADHVDAVDVRVRIATLAFLDDASRWHREIEAALGHAEKALGPDHPHTIGARGTLASALRSLGFVQAAREAAERTFADAERVLGADHPRTLEARGQLSSSLVAANDPRARDLEEQTLAQLDRVLGSEHPATLSSRVALADIVAELGDRPRAKLALEKAVADHERTLGHEHIYTSSARLSLASVLFAEAEQLRMARDLLGAEETLHRVQTLQEQTVSTFERGFGTTSPRTLVMRGLLATTRYRLGEGDEADALLRESVQRVTEEAGPDSESALAARQVEADVLGVVGEVARSRTLLETLVAERDRVQGPRHPDTISTRYELAGKIAQLDGSAEGHTVYLRVLADCEAAFGERHPQTLAALRAVGDSSLVVGDVAGAHRAFERAAVVSSAILGTEHLDTLQARRRHAELVVRSGDDARAELRRLRADYENLVARSESELGPQHPHTLLVRSELATTLDRMGLADRAAAAAPTAGGTLVIPLLEGWTVEEEVKTVAVDGSANVLASTRPADAEGAGPASEEEFLRAFPKYERLAGGSSEAFGGTGTFRHYRWDPGDGAVEQIQAYGEARGRSATATATAHAHAFDRLRGELEATLFGVRIEKGRRLQRLTMRLRGREREVRGVLRLRLPGGWTGTESLTARDPQGEATVSTLVEMVDPGLGSRDYAESQVALLTESFRALQVIESRPARVFGARDGVLQVFTFVPVDGEPLLSLQAYYAEGGLGYVATGSCRIADFARVGGAITELILGVRLAGDRVEPADELPPGYVSDIAERGTEWMMSLPDQVVEECYERTAMLLEQIFGEDVRREEDQRAFTVWRGGSTFARITVHAMTGYHSAVLVDAPVVFDVEPSEELCRFLLEANEGLLFGGFALTQDSAVIFRHSILGDSMDPDELAASVSLVLATADDYDDRLVERFGGRTAVELTDAGEVSD